MSKRVYVGNLPYTTDEDSLIQLFDSEVGEVTRVHIVLDKYTGRSKGFAFIEFNEVHDATEAIEKLNGHEFGGRTIKVSTAKPIVPRPPRGGFGRQKF